MQFFILSFYFLLEALEPCDVLRVRNTCQYDDTAGWYDGAKKKKLKKCCSDTFSINIKHYKRHKGIIELSV